MGQGIWLPLEINSGDTVEGGYVLAMPGKHPAATVTVANANIQTDVLCLDGSSYTLSIPLEVDQKYSFAANSDSTQPSPFVIRARRRTPVAVPVVLAGR